MMIRQQATACALATLLALTACGQQKTDSTDGTASADANAAADQTSMPAPGQDADSNPSAQLITYLDSEFKRLVLDRSPETQSYLGIKTDYGKWDDSSKSFAKEGLELFRDSVAKMKQDFDRSALDAQGKLSYDLYIDALEDQEKQFKWYDYNYAFNQMFGRQSRAPAFLINQHQVGSEADAVAYIERLEGFEAMMDQYVRYAKESFEKGIYPPRFVYDHVLRDARNVIVGQPYVDDAEEASTLLDDLNTKLDALDVTDERKAELKERGVQALKNSVYPAYKTVIAEMERQKETATTDDGVWKLPKGEAFYAYKLEQMTTTDLTADQIHQTGLDEVARIHDEMRQIMDTVDFEGTLQEFFVFMREDEQFYLPNTDEGRQEYLDLATKLIDDMKDRLPELFATLPEAELKVKRVEEFREVSAGKAFYQRPAPDGSRPGVYYANLYDMAEMPVYQAEALAYHEGVPGHHMQIAIAQELEGIPMFRKFGGYTAYIEGWGLYSEYVPKEIGLYEDPYSDFGRLAMELWRAGRLVVDTGLHHKKWTREEAIQYLVDNTPNAKRDCEKAIERYIVYPGQATAYKIGMLKILELRAKAKAELGDNFDIRGFHDVVLRSGAVPLGTLETMVDEWIAELKV